VVTETNFAFALSDLPGYSQFTGLFDQYRFNKVKVMFVPQENSAYSFTSSTGLPGEFITARDYDNVTALGTVNALLEYDNVSIKSMLAATTVELSPRVAIAAYSGAFTSFANQDSQWIDSSSSGVQHFGLRTMCTGSTNLVYTLHAYAEYDLSFRAQI
jgi:hypothetical protein